MAPADLMVEPGKFANPPIAADPATGKPVLTGAGALPWAIDTLSLGGALRAKLIRLQDYVRQVIAGDKR